MESIPDGYRQGIGLGGSTKLTRCCYDRSGGFTFRYERGMSCRKRIHRDSTGIHVSLAAGEAAGWQRARGHGDPSRLSGHVHVHAPRKPPKSALSRTSRELRSPGGTGRRACFELGRQAWPLAATARSMRTGGSRLPRGFSSPASSVGDFGRVRLSPADCGWA
jgi:hypothetical protein